MKPFDQNPSESSRTLKKPKHYACTKEKAFIELKGRKNTINVVLDSGSNIFLRNQDTAQRPKVATQTQDSPLKITSFDGLTAPAGGLFYTHPISLEISANGHWRRIACKMANKGKHDLIIPFGWWHDERLLKNIADPSRWVLEEAKCHAHTDHEAVADLFPWDQTVAYDEEAHYVGRIKREEEGGIQLVSLPKPYWQFKDLFEEKKAKRLAPRRTFDHAISLKEGA